MALYNLEIVPDEAEISGFNPDIQSLIYFGLASFDALATDAKERTWDHLADDLEDELVYNWQENDLCCIYRLPVTREDIRTAAEYCQSAIYKAAEEGGVEV